MRAWGAYWVLSIIALVIALTSCASHPGDLFGTDDEEKGAADGGIEGEDGKDASRGPEDGGLGEDGAESDAPVDAGVDLDSATDEWTDSEPDADSGDGESPIGDGGSGSPTVDEDVGKECSSRGDCEHIPGYEGHGGFCNELNACSAYCAKHDDCGCAPGTTTDDIAAGACAALCTGDGFPRCHRLCRTDDDCEGRQRCRTWMTDIPFCQ